MNQPHQSWAIVRCDVPAPPNIARTQHMVQAIDCLAEIMSDYILAELLTEEVLQNAKCRSFGIMAEAAAGTSLTFRRTHSAVNWNRWKRYGRRLLRECYRVNYKRLWEHWQPKTLPLRRQLLTVLAQSKPAASV